MLPRWPNRLRNIPRVWWWTDDGVFYQEWQRGKCSITIVLFNQNNFMRGFIHSFQPCFLKQHFIWTCAQVGSVEIAASPDRLHPAVGMHSLGEEVLLDLNAEWGTEEDDGLMIVDSHEEDWSRLHDVRVTGTVSPRFKTGKTKITFTVPLILGCWNRNPEANMSFC